MGVQNGYIREYIGIGDGIGSTGRGISSMKPEGIGVVMGSYSTA